MFDKSGFIEYTELFTLMKIRITAIRKASYPDLMAKYENPIEHTCDVLEGQEWISIDGWMKNPNSAMISCNDGFRPVSFYIEVI